MGGDTWAKRCPARTGLFGEHRTRFGRLAGPSRRLTAVRAAPNGRCGLPTPPVGCPPTALTAQAHGNRLKFLEFAVSAPPRPNRVAPGENMNVAVPVKKPNLKP